MTSDRQWFTAKYGNVPSFTASVRRQEKHYRQSFPVRVGWFRRNVGFIIAGLSAVGIVVAWAGVILLTFHLLPGAIEAELDRQIAVVEQQVKGVQR
jgi:hypothetical protein